MNTERDVGRVLGQLELILDKLDGIDRKLESKEVRIASLERYKSYSVGIMVALVAVSEMAMKVLGR